MKPVVQKDKKNKLIDAVKRGAKKVEYSHDFYKGNKYWIKFEGQSAFILDKKKSRIYRVSVNTHFPGTNVWSAEWLESGIGVKRSFLKDYVNKED